MNFVIQISYVWISYVWISYEFRMYLNSKVKNKPGHYGRLVPLVIYNQVENTVLSKKWSKSIIKNPSHGKMWFIAKQLFHQAMFSNLVGMKWKDDLVTRSLYWAVICEGTSIHSCLYFEFCTNMCLIMNA